MASHKAQIHHVYLGDRRTTVSLEDSVAFFMALKLGQEPRTAEAKQAIRQWLQDRLNENDNPGRILVSSWLKFEALLWLVDKILSIRYGEWLDREIES